MIFNVALYAGLFLASGTLAVPPGLAARLAPRHEGRQSQVNQLLELDVNTTSNEPYSSNWAGAMWDRPQASNFPPGTFDVVTGTFTIPSVSGPAGSYASAWVGIDGHTCKNVTFQAGVDFAVTASGITYNAWCEWYPEPTHHFPASEISFAVGHKINVTVDAISKNAGTAIIHNLSTGQIVRRPLISAIPLCMANAEWIVEDPKLHGVPVPFANFGTVNFTDARAGAYNPTGATLLNIEQNGRVLTSVTTSGSSVAIKYV